LYFFVWLQSTKSPIGDHHCCIVRSGLVNRNSIETSEMPFGMRPAVLYGVRSKQMKKALLAMVLLAGSALAGPRISIGIGFGAPAPLAMVRPACPGPGYAWVDGYYGRNRAWVPGFWRRPAVVAPRFVAPHSFSYDRRNDYRHDDHGRNDHSRDFRHDFRR
jgi:hypothetical protein